MGFVLQIKFPLISSMFTGTSDLSNGSAKSNGALKYIFYRSYNFFLIKMFLSLYQTTKVFLLS